MTDLPTPDQYQIESISFLPDGSVSIAYVDPERTNKSVMLANQVTFDPKVAIDLVSDLHSTACATINEVLISLRAPADYIRGARP